MQGKEITGAALVFTDLDGIAFDICIYIYIRSLNPGTSAESLTESDLDVYTSIF